MISSDFKELIRPLNEEEYAALEKSIIDEGCRDRLVMWNGFIIDGHHRYQICQKNNIEFNTVSLEFDNKEQAMLWIINTQLARRNLNKEEYAYFIGKKYQQEKKFSGDRGKAHQNDEAFLTKERIAQEHGVSPGTVERNAVFAQDIDTIDENVGGEVKDKILSGKIKATKTDIRNLAKMKPNEQQKVIEISEVIPKRDLRKALQQKRIEDNLKEKDPIPLPLGKFAIIYADPPWQYDFSPTRSRSIDIHYPILTLEQIKNLDIPCADNSVLFLWSTAPKTLEALDVMRAWGFTYKTQAIWDKEIIGMGYWFRGQHETLLVGTRGSFPPPNPKNRFSSIIRQKRTKHSKKPDIIYEIIEKMFPNQKYLEVFARKIFNGNWTAWGNEL